MPRTRSGVRYRSTALDRALAPARTVATVGPIEGLSADRLGTILDAVARCSPVPRSMLIPEGGRRRWDYDTTTSDHVVTSRPDLDTDDQAALVTAVRNRPGPRRPLEVIVCGDHLVLDYSHGVGDGQLGILGLAVLAGGDESRAPILAAGLPSTAVWTAAWRHYRSRPSALADVVRLRKQHKQFDVGRDGEPLRRIDHWQSAKCSVGAHLDASRVEDLRAWTKRCRPGATTASVTVALWMAALRAEGVRIDDRVMILINCRRYLGDAYRTAQGNFAVGIPIVMPPSGSPEDIARLTRRVIDSGWPLAILGMAELTSALHRPQASEATDVVDVPDRLRLAVSDLGRLTAFDGVTWKPGRPPQFSAYLEPDGPDALTLLADDLSGGRTFTASFCSEMIAPSVVSGALQRMCADPIGLLTER